MVTIIAMRRLQILLGLPCPLIRLFVPQPFDLIEAGALARVSWYHADQREKRTLSKKSCFKIFSTT